ncbi:MAG: Glycerophosphoryl diester esterase [uncultured bacterium]|nr:MAG: Glycerophosphoryl diester esterase [uncultured bacterium]
MLTIKELSSALSPLIAHRGASALAPENTLSAFQKAKEMGAKWVEFDVMLAACGTPIVIHDETLERTTNGSGRVDDYSYHDLQKLDAGSWFDAHFAGERIPTLIEVVDLLNKQQLFANIEIKPIAGKEEETVVKVLEIIEQCWQKNKFPPLISSFSRPVLYSVRKHSQTALLGFLLNQWYSDWEAVCDELQCLTVHVNQRILTLEKSELIKKTGRLLLSYTIDNEKSARQLFSLGVDAIFSNCPDAMRVFLNR